MVNVLTVGSNGLFIGTPATASAAQGTALGRLERRIRRIWSGRQAESGTRRKGEARVVGKEARVPSYGGDW